MAVKRKFPIRVATVYCNGGCRAKKKMEYQAEDCATAAALCEGGPLECAWGCLGCGTCVAACKFDAIHINEHGVAEVDEEKCIGCGLCAKKCPRELIRVRQQGAHFVVLCSNESKGADARKVCDVSCIGCGLCAKKCPAEAIQIENFHAVINEADCLGCGMCAVVCPRHAIIDKEGVLTEKR